MAQNECQIKKFLQKICKNGDSSRLNPNSVYFLNKFFTLILVMSTAGCQSRSNSKISENNASGTITDIFGMAYHQRQMCQNPSL